MKYSCLTLTALLLAAPMASAQTSHSKDHASHGMNHSSMAMSGAQMEGAVHTKAVLNTIGKDTANVSHEPIPEIGWPAMTMDLALAPDAQMMGGVAPGDAVTLMLIKGEDGMYMIAAIMPN